MRMQQTIADFEDQFVEEIAEDRERGERLARQAQLRTQRRRVQRQRARGTLRFLALFLVLLATAVLVTVAMFETLYRVMG
jgi:hypothetical protein